MDCLKYFDIKFEFKMHLLTRVVRPTVFNSARLLGRSRVRSYRDKEGHEFTTDDINRGVPYTKIFGGIAAAGALLGYAIYTTEHGQVRKETYFAERYPDPRIKVLHQVILRGSASLHLSKILGNCNSRYHDRYDS